MRLRWRLRGAWQWPAFAVVTVAEAVLLNELPVWGEGAGGLWPGLLLASAFNLVLVAIVAPVAGRLLRARRPDLPAAIAKDYAGAVLISALFAGLVVAGLAHRGDLQAQERAAAAQAHAVIAFVRGQEPEYTAGLDSLDTLRLEPSMYRTCVPGPDPDRPLCLFVRTDQSPPGITRDTDRAPNDAYRRAGSF